MVTRFRLKEEEPTGARYVSAVASVKSIGAARDRNERPQGNGGGDPLQEQVNSVNLAKHELSKVSFESTRK